MTPTARRLLVAAAVLFATTTWAAPPHAGQDRRTELERQLARVDTLLASRDVNAADSVADRLRAGWLRFGARGRPDSLAWLDAMTCKLHCIDATGSGLVALGGPLADSLLGVAKRHGATTYKRGEILSVQASIYLQSRMFSEALETCERIFDELEGSITVLDPVRASPGFLNLAKRFREGGFHEGERRLLEKVCAYRENLGPGDAESLEAKLYLGELAEDLGDWHEAIERYRQVWSYGGRAWNTGDWHLKRAEEKLRALLNEHGGRREDDPRAVPVTRPRQARHGVGPDYAEAIRELSRTVRDSSTLDPESWQSGRTYRLTAARSLERLAEECDQPSLSCADLLFRLDTRQRDTSPAWRGWVSSLAYWQLLISSFAANDLTVANGLCQRMFDAGAMDTVLVADARDAASGLAGWCATQRRDWKTAEADFQRNLAVQSSPTGRAGANTALSLIGLLRGNPDVGYSRALVAVDLLHGEFNRFVSQLGFDQAMRESGDWREDLGLLLSCALASREAGRAEVAWTRFMDCRGAVSNEFAERRHMQAVRARAASQRQALLIRQNALLVNGGRESESLARSSLPQIRRELARLDEILAAPPPAQDHRDCSDLARALPDSAAMLAFARLRYVGVGDTMTPASVLLSDSLPKHYFACLIRRGHSVALKDLGPASMIDSLVNAWRRTLLAGSRTTSPDRGHRLLWLGRELRARLWDPWTQALQGIGLLFVVPDGALQRLPLACLPVGEDRFLVESGPAITYLTHERDLRPKGAPTSELGAGALILGAPAFDPGLQASDSAGVGMDAGSRGLESDCADLSQVHWRDLPGSLEEARAVAARLRRPSPSWRDTTDIRLLTGEAASEGIVKESCAGRRVVHLATHAFVFDRACTPSGSDDAPTQDPLLLAGVVLAGANRKAPPSMSSSDDGILTAGEVAELDLSQAEWAVLSGCDTGSGESIDSECVLGLQRAFRIAGAHTLIMSMWPVRDDMAAVWMRELYLHKFDEGRNTADAVRLASRALIDRMRHHHDFPDPRYWGAFVGSGNWR